MWQTLRDQCQAKLEAHEARLQGIVFRTREPLDPVEIEYYRGFRQGVMYVLDGLPNGVDAELVRQLANSKENA